MCEEVQVDPIPRIDDPWSRSQLFTVRVWYEQAERNAPAVRIQARHVLTGETRYFSAWPPLIDYLLTKLDSPPRLADSA